MLFPLVVALVSILCLLVPFFIYQSRRRTNTFTPAALLFAFGPIFALFRWPFDALHERLSLKRSFILACARVAHGYSNKRITLEQFEHLYGLYKQATFGDFNLQDTADASLEEVRKWERWKHCTGISKQEAMLQYIRLANDLLGPYKNESLDSSFSSAISRLKVVSDISTSCNDESFYVAVAKGDCSLVQRMLKGKVFWVEIVQDVLEDLSLVFKASPEGLTALHLAVDRGHYDIVQVLLGRGANVNAQDENGDTPLHMASVRGNKKMTDLLLRHGANGKIRNHDGEYASEQD